MSYKSFQQWAKVMDTFNGENADDIAKRFKDLPLTISRYYSIYDVVPRLAKYIKMITMKSVNIGLCQRFSRNDLICTYRYIVVKSMKKRNETFITVKDKLNTHLENAYDDIERCKKIGLYFDENDILGKVYIYTVPNRIDIRSKKINIFRTHSLEVVTFE